MFRVGKLQNGEQKQKRRTLIVKFRSECEVKRILARASKLRHYGKKVFISPELTEEELQIERKLLAKRYQLIQNGTFTKERVRVRNCKLLLDGKELIDN